MPYVLSMPLSEATNLVAYAVEEEQREQFYKLWLAKFTTYTPENFETFDMFYEKYKPQKIVVDTRSKDDIMNDILATERKLNGTI